MEIPSHTIGGLDAMTYIATSVQYLGFYIYILHLLSAAACSNYELMSMILCIIFIHVACKFTLNSSAVCITFTLSPGQKRLQHIITY